MATATALAPLFVSASAQTIRPLQIEDAVSARDFLIQGHLAVIGPTSRQTRYWTAGDEPVDWGIRNVQFALCRNKLS